MSNNSNGNVKIDKSQLIPEGLKYLNLGNNFIDKILQPIQEAVTKKDEERLKITLGVNYVDYCNLKSNLLK